MTRWQTLASWVVVLTLAGSARAQTCALTEAPLTDNHYRVQVSMSLTGELTVQQNDKLVGLPTSAKANHTYLERVLAPGPDGTANKSARIYQEAKATITVEKETMTRTFRPTRTFLIAQRDRDQTVTYCPLGALTHEELDLTDHLDTLAITGLLPQKDVAVGDSWKVANLAVQALCHLQGLTEHSLTGKLEQVKDGLAVFKVAGIASGIDEGASVKVTIDAACQFDVQQRRLVSVDWKQTDVREPGPVSPASTMTVVTQLRRTPVAPVNELSDVALATWSVSPQDRAPPTQEKTALYFKDREGRFELLHSRDWQLVGETSTHLVLRLMDRGEFVAQASIAPWKKAEPGKHMLEAEFVAMVGTAPGWEGKVLPDSAKAQTLENGQWTYFVAAEGELDGVHALQDSYLVAGPNGDQVVLTFTMTPAQAQKLGSRDLELVRGLTLPGARKAN
jgi:hypothetical protein